MIDGPPSPFADVSYAARHGGLNEAPAKQNKSSIALNPQKPPSSTQEKIADKPPGEAGEGINLIYRSLVDTVTVFNGIELRGYSRSMDIYSKIYSKMIDVAKPSEWLSTKDSDKEKSFIVGPKLKEGLVNLIEECRPRRNGLFLMPDKKYVIASFAENEKEKCQDLLDKLGLSTEKDVSMVFIPAHRNPEGKSIYIIVPDISPLEKMVLLLDGKENVDLSLADYNVWKTSFDIQVSRFEDAMKTRGQKYGNIVSQFEHFYKTISSIIETLARSLRGYLQF